MERQRREEELKTHSTKKGQDTWQALLNRVGDLFLQCKVDEFLKNKCIEWILFLPPPPLTTMQLVSVVIQSLSIPYSSYVSYFLVLGNQSSNGWFRSQFVHCFEDSLDNTLFVLYIYDDGIRLLIAYLCYTYMMMVLQIFVMFQFKILCRVLGE